MSREIFKTVLTVAAAFMLASHGASVAAAAQRTFVASHGLDTDPCTLVQPCRSFAAAIVQTAAHGEVIVLDSAGYGPVTIAQSASIIAPPGVYAGISVSSGDGITINAPGGIVTLHGLTINGLGTGNHGILMVDGVRLHVERCEISRMTVNGIQLQAPGSVVFVNDTIVRDNLQIGIAIRADLVLVIDRVRLEGNDAGLASIAAPNITVRDSLVARQTGSGIFLGVGPGAGTGQLTVVDTMLSDNSSGVGVSSGGATKPVILHVARSTFARNGIGVSLTVLGIGGSARAVIADNLLVGSTIGIFVDAMNMPASASVTATGNRITDNAKGVLVRFMGELRTAQNNVIDSNALADIDSSAGGIVTFISGM